MSAGSYYNSNEELSFFSIFNLNKSDLNVVVVSSSSSAPSLSLANRSDLMIDGEKHVFHERLRQNNVFYTENSAGEGL